jgi:BRCT domain type II-containing protein
MARITPPRSPDVYPDRHNDCQMAAEDAFQELVANVVAAGWGAEEVAAAIEDLAKNHRLALREVAATEAAIRAARRKSP